MKIGRGTSAQKTYGGIYNIFGQKNTIPVERSTADDTDFTSDAYVTLSTDTALRRVNAMTYSQPTAGRNSDKIYNYKSGSRIFDVDVAKMKPGDKIIYKTDDGAIVEYTYKKGDTAQNIMSVIKPSSTNLNSAIINSNSQKYLQNVNALKIQNTYAQPTYSDGYVEVMLSPAAQAFIK